LPDPAPKDKGKLNVMSALDDEDNEQFSKTREHLLSQN